MALTMVCGLATEAWSRPDKREADGYRGWVGDPVRTERIMMLECKKRAYRDRNLLLRPELPRVYPYEQTLRTLPWQQRNEYENQPVPPAPPPLTYMERRELRDYARAYTLNYAYRMLPHTVGWFPYVACWVVYFSSFISSLEDVRQENESLYDRIPDFVPWAVGGTALWFTSFTFVQWRYQYISPGAQTALLPFLHPGSQACPPADFYWKTEFIYCALSLGSKLTLGLLLYINVLRFSSFDEALNDTVVNRAAAAALLASPPPPP